MRRSQTGGGYHGSNAPTSTSLISRRVCETKAALKENGRPKSTKKLCFLEVTFGAARR